MSPTGAKIELNAQIKSILMSEINPLKIEIDLIMTASRVSQLMTLSTKTLAKG